VWYVFEYTFEFVLMDAALRTGRQDFTDLCRKLADVFLSLLPRSGVPWWYVCALPQMLPHTHAKGFYRY